MMNYQLQYKILAQDFTQQKTTIDIQELTTCIVNYKFESEFSLVQTKTYIGTKNNIDTDLLKSKSWGNDHFIYSVFLPNKFQKYNKAILLLHGLNERSWEKYLVWASYLAQNTNQPVILFPLAFHMNRSPIEWNDPRTMMNLSEQRKTFSPGLNHSSYLNAAISTRIENNPEQFFLSGMQSFIDVVRFIRSIKQGNHPNFMKNTLINICSYSIGAFLSQILVMDNPLGLFDSTKLFLFCGGATFDQMNGASKFIIDSKAFAKLKSLANVEYFSQIKKYFDEWDMPELQHTWDPLYYMTFLKEGAKMREHRLNAIGERIYAIGLENDKVVPPQAIILTLKGIQNNLPSHVEILDFPYPYTHENPFPIKNKNFQNEVDHQFKIIFDKVATYLG